MLSLTTQQWLSRLLAPLAALALCLTPAGESAPPEQAPVSAAEAPVPEADPIADAYLDAAARLTALGLEQTQIDVLWSRFGPSLPELLDSGALSAPALDCLSLPYGRVELLDRYLSYREAAPELSLEDVVTYVNIGLDTAFYSNVQEAVDLDSTGVLVNKYYALPGDYVPEELTALASQYGSGSLTPEAAGAFVRMADAARLDGISLRSVSAYRSYQTQATLYRNYTAQSGAALADTYSARPGHSEHQTGLALDINVARTTAHFENTPAFAWLQENCAQYGFLLRYPQDKRAITGYRFEPWHYRYVGVETAQACMEQGLTYDEYIARLPVPGAYALPTLPGGAAAPG